MADENKQLQDKVKKQEREITELKRAVNILQKQLQQLQAGYNRASDQNRRNATDIQKLTLTIRNLRRTE